MSTRAFCLVLHGHLPWVLHHGRWPHGEDWLFEAAAETWLPLLEVLDRCERDGIRPAWTVGLMPILLEQLTHERFRLGFERYLEHAIERADADAEGLSCSHQAWLAERWSGILRGRLDRFREIEGDIVGALVGHAERGAIELLTSNATHAYHPLLLHDACARAQIRAGRATSARHFGFQPSGMWLPECAYRPSGPWMPPALHGDVRYRDGVGAIVGAEDVGFYFVDTHLLPDDVLRPYRVLEGGRQVGPTVLGRCPDVSEQVWSGKVGYPGDPCYLEFHKREGAQGLRYWKVTGREIDLGDKELYYPDDVGGVVHRHGVHFVDQVLRRLGEHGGDAVVTAPFDAELFGHWWHEGPEFLYEVAARIHHNADVVAMTASEAIAAVDAPPAALPEGSWGAGGDHRVWNNDELRWYWEMAYRAEDRFLDLWHRTPWRVDGEIRELLTEAGRQLLLLQASDWPFVIHTRGAVDYGMRRIHEHAGLFDDLAIGVEDAASGRPRDPVVTAALERARLLDPVFPDLDLAWWT